jgi:hypothetical protein
MSGVPDQNLKLMREIRGYDKAAACCIEESGGEILNPMWIAFICGCLLGGIGGIALMCLFSLSSQTDPYDNE